MNPNIAARLAERAALHPERPAIVEGAGASARRLTFGGLDQRVRALAAGLFRNRKPAFSAVGHIGQLAGYDTIARQFG